MNTILFVVIGLLLGVLVSHAFELSLKKNKLLKNKYYRHHEIIFGYHIHHSMYGLLCFVASLIFALAGRQPFSLFFLATGIGIITMHTIFDGRLIFIEKEKPK
jgi:hypothetical protein